jgi:hypothetical protein
MLIKILLFVLMTIFSFYKSVRRNIFRLIPKIIVVYYFDGNRLKNITLRYHTGTLKKKYHNGIFYLKIIDSRESLSIAFEGHISEIEQIDLEKIPRDVVRRNILLMDQDVPSKINLENLDNYRRAMVLFNGSIRNMKDIMDLMNVKCTHICEIQSIPFSMKKESIKNVSIDDLYL